MSEESREIQSEASREMLIPPGDDVAGWDVPARTMYYPFSLDFSSILRRFPPFEDYFKTCGRMTRDELDAVQNKRLLTQVERAWRIPFYQRLWGEAGAEPGDIRSIDDLEKLPIFSVYDLRKDIEGNPPFGSFQGIYPRDGEHTPLRLVTSGGTSGVPRPMFYPAWDREISAIIGSRVHYAHGLRPGMIAQIVNGLSTVNGGIYQMECIWKYCGAIPVTTGGGNATPTDMQVAMARQYGSTFVDGFPDYIRRIGSRAEELGLDPSSDLKIDFISTMLGRQDRSDLEQLFGATVYDSYGISEAGGYVSTECPERVGRHVMEDAYIMEVVDRESHAPVPPDTAGSVVITSLFKVGAPMIRYNTNDLSVLSAEECPCGNRMRLQGQVLGRTDDLIKVKGMWVHPEGVGEIVKEDERTAGEYVCILEEGQTGDRLRVLVESGTRGRDAEVLTEDLTQRFKSQFGVTLEVEHAEPESLEPLTKRSSTRTGKARRLIDRRNIEGTAQ